MNAYKVTPSGNHKPPGPHLKIKAVVFLWVYLHVKDKTLMGSFRGMKTGYLGCP